VLRLLTSLALMFSLDLQLLQLWTESFVVAIINSAKKMPYSMRYLARETLLAAQVRQSNVFDRLGH
jgi:Ras GTPase-activating-like protein IQGAP2/3